MLIICGKIIYSQEKNIQTVLRLKYARKTPHLAFNVTITQQYVQTKNQPDLLLWEDRNAAILRRKV